MTVISTRIYQPAPGRWNDFFANAALGREIAQSAGAHHYKTSTALAGGSWSTTAAVSYEADTWAHLGLIEQRAREHARIEEAINSERGSDPAAQLLSIVVLQTIPVDGVPDAGEGLPITAGMVWSAADRRVADSIMLGQMSLRRCVELGAANARLSQHMIAGEQSGQLQAMLEFADLEAFGRFLDASATDEQMLQLNAWSGGPHGPSAQWAFSLWETVDL